MSTFPIADIPADAATTGTASGTSICPAPFITAVLQLAVRGAPGRVGDACHRAGMAR
jgi:hypothetical protein